MADVRHVLSLLRQADPASTAELAPPEVDPLWQTITNRIEAGHTPIVLHAVHDPEGGTDMTTTSTPTTGASRTRRPWTPRIAAALLAVAAVAAAVWAIARVTGTPDVVTDERGIPAPVGELERAFDAGDLSGVEAVFTPDATDYQAGRTLFAAEGSRIPRWFSNQFALDAEIDVVSCEPFDGGADEGSHFTCTVTGSNAVSRAVGHEGRQDVRFAIVGDRIAQADLLTGITDPRVGNIDALAELGGYLFENHFEEYDAACGATTDPLLVDPSCMEFVTGYVDEFVAARS